MGATTRARHRICRLAPFSGHALNSQRQVLMVVRTQCIGHAFTGVIVGAWNARRYFSKDAAAIELQLDHLLIECVLAPDFWRGHSEICDPRLRLWLEAKNFNGRRGDAPVPLAMIPSGKNAFRLLPIPGNGRPKPKPTSPSTLPEKQRAREQGSEGARELNRIPDTCSPGSLVLSPSVP